LNSERSSLFTDGLAELQLQAAKEKKEASLASSTYGRKSKTDKVNTTIYATDDVDDCDDHQRHDDDHHHHHHRR